MTCVPPSRSRARWGAGCQPPFQTPAPIPPPSSRISIARAARAKRRAGMEQGPQGAGRGSGSAVATVVVALVVDGHSGDRSIGGGGFVLVGLIQLRKLGILDLLGDRLPGPLGLGAGLRLQDHQVIEFIDDQAVEAGVGAHLVADAEGGDALLLLPDRKSTRLNSSHVAISYAVFCLKKTK